MLESLNYLIFDRNLLLQRSARTANSLAKSDFLIKRSFADIYDRLNDMTKEFPMTLNLGHSSIVNEENFMLEANKFDLIISILNLHNINDLPGCLIRLKNALKPGGMIIASMFGGNNLFQLREVLLKTELELFGGVSPRMMPNIEIKQLGGLLQRAGFSSPIVDSDIVEVHYKQPLDLLHDLRNMGETNIMLTRDKKYLGKRFWRVFA